jgi:hypothetical protein
VGDWKKGMWEESAMNRFFFDLLVVLVGNLVFLREGKIGN